VRKLICFLLAIFFLNLKEVTDSDDPYIIRRAYIDVLGVVLTSQEIE
jgi:hypothetical protein